MHSLTPLEGEISAGFPTPWRREASCAVPKQRSLRTCRGGSIILHKVKSDEAGAAALCGLVAIGLLLAIVTPAQKLEHLLAKIKSVKVGSLDIELNDYRQLAADKGQASNEEGAGHDSTMFELKGRLESRLAFLAKHHFCDATDPQHPIPAYLNIGSLEYDKYLTHAQAKVAYEILGMRQVVLRQSPSEDQKDFIEGANEFVNTFRVQVLANEVANALRVRGWQVEQAYPSKPRLRDLLVSRPGEPGPVTHHIVPLYVRSQQGASIVEEVRKRLTRDDATKGAGQQVIVVPPGSRVVDDQSPIPIVTLPSLLEMLLTPAP